MKIPAGSVNGALSKVAPACHACLKPPDIPRGRAEAVTWREGLRLCGSLEEPGSLQHSPWGLAEGGWGVLLSP